MNIKKATYLIIFLIAIVFILIIGKSLIIPIVLAGLIWFLIKEMRDAAKKIKWIKRFIPSWLLTLLSVGTLYVVLGIIVNLLIHNINNLSENIPIYEANLQKFSDNLSTQLDIDFESMWTNFIGDFDFANLLSTLLSSFTELLGNTFMISLYVVFMLLEEALFEGKFNAIYKTKNKRLEMQASFKQISDSISRYISLKTIVSVLTGGLSYIALAIIGIDSPLFWAFLIFILNYIPSIGSLIGTLFPAIMALLQLGDINIAIIVLVSVGTIQLIVGNIIEPKMMGNSLNVSSLVVILALSFWGAIWGVTGMVLSVPITVIIVILCGQFESTKNIAILLSEKGKIN